MLGGVEALHLQLTHELLRVLRLVFVEMIQQEHTVEVIELVLDEAAEQLVGFEAHLVAVEIETGDLDLLRTTDLEVPARHRQTSLVEPPFAVGTGDPGVDQHSAIGLAIGADVIDEETLLHTDLRGGETEAGGGIHRGEHVVDQLVELAVDLGDLVRLLAKNRVADDTNGVGRHDPYPTRVTEQYFSSEPGSVERPRELRLDLADLSLRLSSDSGVFSADRIDPGTRVLLAEAPRPLPSLATIADIGCGYGPIALTIAARAPSATVWAIDVNARARELCRENARRNNLDNVVVASPDDVPADLRFDAIWSNPPIRIGKSALHTLLGRWLDRLDVGGHAWLVVNKHLGADSLAAWLTESGWNTQRLVSRQAYRILEVAARVESHLN